MGHVKVNAIGDGTNMDGEEFCTVSDTPAMTEGAITQAKRNRVREGIDRKGVGRGESMTNKEGGRGTAVE